MRKNGVRVVSRTIGFVGAGRIGEPMVERLLAAGHRVRLYARRAEVRDRLVAAGAESVAQVRDIADSDVVISCLFSDDQIAAVLPAVVGAMASGTVLLSHTTGTPATLRGLRNFARDGAPAIVDAPFSGTADAVRAGELVVFLGGEPAHVAVAREVIGSYAGSIIDTGPACSALHVKLINNLLFAAIAQLTLNATEIAAAQNITESAMLDALALASAGSTAGRYIAARGGSAGFTASVEPFLRKDVAAVREALADSGADLSTLLSAAYTGPMHLRHHTTIENGSAS
ncbi:NAD(P)-binding domain-containing protein [Nocardia sp. CA2R105]|uniref:NAD(P)-dependent oxidoreductase n=1 Tax=Nocardia coffeae TaxID=2873381 RepID=UPI001CA6C435|nr:NAD(P)-binding domain-containing protein [Nocardia coffeae]MBY8860932.1 NAD(P)-binding domain-containing protein [Nocardia coffeae]